MLTMVICLLINGLSSTLCLLQVNLQMSRFEISRMNTKMERFHSGAHLLHGIDALDWHGI